MNRSLKAKNYKYLIIMYLSNDGTKYMFSKSPIIKLVLVLEVCYSLHIN